MDVASVMTPRAELVTATVPGSREDILRILQRGEFSAVPIVKEADGEEVFRGLVSREQLIEEPDEEQIAMLLEEIEPIAPDATVTDLAQHMVRTGERRVPVVDGGLAGIVTITDVVRAIADEALPGDRPVGDVCDRKITTVYEGTPLSVSQHMMYYADELYAVVLDHEGDMTGIVTEVDLIEVAEVVDGAEGTGESIAEQDSEWAWEGIKAIGNRLLPTRNVELPDADVSAVMTADVVTISRNRSVTETAQLMIRHDIEQIPLVHGGELKGTVKDMHLLEALYE